MVNLCSAQATDGVTTNTPLLARWRKPNVTGQYGLPAFRGVKVNSRLGEKDVTISLLVLAGNFSTELQ